DSASKADIIIYNTCAVKGPTENRVVAALKRVPKGKKVIVAGCLPLINFERLKREVRFDGVVGPAAGGGIIDVVRRVLADEQVVDLEGALKAKPMLNLPQLRANPMISIIPVSYGCLGSCAYCCVVSARGRLRSYRVNEVTERVRKDLAAGTKEFWVTSQDTACYGIDVDRNLVTLLNALVDIDGDFHVRVGMMTPNLVKDMLPDIVEAFRSSKIFKFVHLPVQSGDDTVLRRMNRFYMIQDFKEIVDAFRAAFSEITLATDVICGFPGETREAFENTLKLIEEVKPDIVNVSKFFSRPGTAAAQMHDTVKPVEIKRRSSEAAKLVKQVALEQNKRWIGWNGEIWVDEKGKVPGSWIGRNFAYKPVTLKSPANLLGKTLQVTIVEAFSTHLEGRAK
ncbi:MAG: tRNA (N(6)-L-threonylcarbamoyladenosine(37)-C(2))-methylthiotransferase, partial [Candidatus Bathyarchaeia archaeon]|nr:tRNA (N(6)-L-threonylcarbamoyladenosine(37)-C(2))-methylthiotransferase [Candidatus Bathyarchaeia archaeon]